MPISYKKQEIIDRIEKASDDMSNFYKQNFVNYQGKTKDTKDYYTEVIAKWLIDHFYLFNEISKITRGSSYKVDTHDGETQREISNREEERIALEMFKQNNKHIFGEIIDYQTPLKNISADDAGKIDLLAYDGQVLRILELKKPDSKETMLRCVLEGYTYLKTVDIGKLIKDFNLPSGTKVLASPLVAVGSKQEEEMNEDRPYLKNLMGKLNSKVFYYDINGNTYKFTVKV